jgi:hypothetical protein
MFGLTRSTRVDKAHRWAHQRELDLMQARIDALDHRCTELDTERLYWRARCERLLDSALAKRGEITAPTMVDVKPRGGLSELFAGPLAGLGVTSIAGKPSPLVHPSLPGQAMSHPDTDPEAD